ncbi:MAG: hypothetical protein JWR61_698 [Ferruginibacter sp.]|nr:hypothetical protein [Ferruginibacter sp.]
MKDSNYPALLFNQFHGIIMIDFLQHCIRKLQSIQRPVIFKQVVSINMFICRFQ